jgi:hypothetical protein
MTDVVTTDLLDKVIEAHGGLQRWNQLDEVSARLIQGGVLWGNLVHMSTTALNPDALTTDTGSQLTAENRSVVIDGDTLVYRRFGNTTSSAPPKAFLNGG